MNQKFEQSQTLAEIEQLKAELKEDRQDAEQQKVASANAEEACTVKNVARERDQA